MTRAHLARVGDADEWARELAGFPSATAFHRFEWLAGIASELGLRFEPLGIVVDGRRVGLLPLLIRPGRLATAPALPFPYVGPLVAEGLLDEALAALRRHLLLHGVVAAAIELPPDSAPGLRAAFSRAVHPVVEETTMVLDLADRSSEELWSGLSSQRRNAVRGSVKRGVTVRPSEVGDGAELLPRLLDEAFGARGRRSPYPATIGAWVDERIAEDGDVLTSITALRDGELVGMLTQVVDGRAAYGWIGGALRAHRDANVASALYWTEIEMCREAGLSRLDLVGEVDSGVRAFKRSFGAAPVAYDRGAWSPIPQRAAAVLRSIRGALRR